VTAALFPFINIPGFGFDNFIRGWLVVATAVLVLMGSVYVLLATNTGARTGLLIGLSALSAWTLIMGLMWWMYGTTGLYGTLPHWSVMEVNRGDLATAQSTKASELGHGLDPQTDNVKQFFDQQEKASADTGAPGQKVAGWTPVLLTNPSRGEAQATVDSFLVDNKIFPSNQDYLTVAAYQTGGKDRRPATDVCQTHNPFKIVTTGTCWRRVGDKLHSIFVQPFHPPHYAAVMVQAADPRTLVSRPGQPPPTKQVDPNQPIVTVLMVRDLGSVRLPPAMLTFGSLVCFISFVTMLHRRDKATIRNRSLVPATTGS
jgi:hypothetical protein